MIWYVYICRLLSKSYRLDIYFVHITSYRFSIFFVSTSCRSVWFLVFSILPTSCPFDLFIFRYRVVSIWFFFVSTSCRLDISFIEIVYRDVFFFNRYRVRLILFVSISYRFDFYFCRHRIDLIWFDFSMAYRLDFSLIDIVSTWYFFIEVVYRHDFSFIEIMSVWFFPFIDIVSIRLFLWASIGRDFFQGLSWAVCLGRAGPGRDFWTCLLYTSPSPRD